MLIRRRLWKKSHVLLRYKSMVSEGTKLDLSVALEQTEKFGGRPGKLNKDGEVPKKVNKDYIVEINQNILSKDMRWAIQKSNRDKKIESDKHSKHDKKSQDIATEEPTERILSNTKKSDNMKIKNEYRYSKEDDLYYKNVRFDKINNSDPNPNNQYDHTKYSKTNSTSDNGIHTQFSNNRGNIKIENSSKSYKNVTKGPRKLESLPKRKPTLMKYLGLQKSPKSVEERLKNHNDINHDKNDDNNDKKLENFQNNRTKFKNNDRVRELFKEITGDTLDSSIKESYRKGNSRMRLKRLNKEPQKFIDNSVKTEEGKISVSHEEFKQSTPLEYDSIPRLAHRLDRTLFSPGVHFLQDPRTRVYNFPPFLKKVIKYEDFDFEAIPQFTKVSKDDILLKAAIENDKQFYSSTSSMTLSLIQFYFLLNNYNEGKPRFNFTPIRGLISSIPSSMIIEPRGTNPKSGKTIYSIESDDSFDTEILLSAMGHCLEAFLTTEEADFKKYNLKYNQNLAKSSEPNVYNYATFGEFLMRSQLDCYDDRLPGNGTFDLKTRAVCSIRYDSSNPDIQNNKYQVWKMNGSYESFDREFQDLIRTGALLKYMFQARIGQMDGIFVAYHNINSIFGFQYLPLEELDNIFYNHPSVEDSKHTIVSKNIDNFDINDINDRLPSFVGETQFKQSLKIWELLMKMIIKDINQKETPFRLFLKTKTIGSISRLYIFAVPITKSQIKQLKEFPSRFETSFKFDLSNQQRLENLKNHRDELTSFNQAMIEGDLGKNILGYYMDIYEQVIDGEVYLQSDQPYPKTSDCNWDLHYRIRKIKNETRVDQDRMRLLLNSIIQPAIDKISRGFEKNVSQDQSQQGITDVLKLYEKIGRARAEAWLQKDDNPIIYEPKK